jgi:dolichol-phosphate mannosyltransferase
LRIQVVLATYNEAECIEEIVRALASVRLSIAPMGNELRLLLVDDESPDGTANLAEAVAQNEGLPISISSHVRNGLGAAYLRGFDVTIREGWAEVIATLDADGQHDPLALPDLLSTFRTTQADLVIGSRWTKGAEVLGLPKSRRFLSRVGIFSFGIATGVRGIKDATTSYRVFSTEVAQAFQPGRLTISGYSFFSSFVGLTAAAGFAIVEHPIVFARRSGGHSKLEPSDVVQFARNLPRLAREVRRVRRNPPVIVTRATGKQVSETHSSAPRAAE